MAEARPRRALGGGAPAGGAPSPPAVDLGYSFCEDNAPSLPPQASTSSLYVGGSPRLPSGGGGGGGGSGPGSPRSLRVPLLLPASGEAGGRAWSGNVWRSSSGARSGSAAAAGGGGAAGGGAAGGGGAAFGVLSSGFDYSGSSSAASNFAKYASTTGGAHSVGGRAGGGRRPAFAPGAAARNAISTGGCGELGSVNFGVLGVAGSTVHYSRPVHRNNTVAAALRRTVRKINTTVTNLIPEDPAYGKKTIGQAGSFIYLVNQIFGAGILALPAVVKAAGWLPSLLANIFVALVGMFGTLMFMRSMTMIAGNQNFEKRVEYIPAVDYFLGRRYRLVTEICFYLSVQSMNVVSIAVVAQTFDHLLLRALGFTGGFTLELASMTPHFQVFRSQIQVDEIYAGATPDGRLLVGLSLGYLLNALICMGLSSQSMEENMKIQYVSFTFLIASILQISASAALRIWVNAKPTLATLPRALPKALPAGAFLVRIPGRVKKLLGVTGGVAVAAAAAGDGGGKVPFSLVPTPPKPVILETGLGNVYNAIAAATPGPAAGVGKYFSASSEGDFLKRPPSATLLDDRMPSNPAPADAVEDMNRLKLASAARPSAVGAGETHYTLSFAPVLPAEEKAVSDELSRGGASAAGSEGVGVVGRSIEGGDRRQTLREDKVSPVLTEWGEEKLGANGSDVSAGFDGASGVRNLEDGGGGGGESGVGGGGVGNGGVTIRAPSVLGQYRYGQVVSTFIASYSYANVIPSWANEMHPRVRVNEAVWGSTAFSCVIYYTFGFLLATAYPAVHTDNILEEVLADANTGPATRVSIYIFNLFTVLPGILVYSITTRYNIVNSGQATPRNGFLIGCVAPFLIAWLLTNDRYFSAVLMWSSLLFSLAVNFVIPLIVYLRACRCQRFAVRNPTRHYEALHKFARRTEQGLTHIVNDVSAQLRNYLTSLPPAELDPDLRALLDGGGRGAGGAGAGEAAEGGDGGDGACTGRGRVRRGGIAPSPLAGRGSILRGSSARGEAGRGDAGRGDADRDSAFGAADRDSAFGAGDRDSALGTGGRDHAFGTGAFGTAASLGSAFFPSSPAARSARSSLERPSESGGARSLRSTAFLSPASPRGSFSAARDFVPTLPAAADAPGADGAFVPAPWALAQRWRNHAAKLGRPGGAQTILFSPSCKFVIQEDEREAGSSSDGRRSGARRGSAGSSSACSSSRCTAESSAARSAARRGSAPGGVAGAARLSPGPGAGRRGNRRRSVPAGAAGMHEDRQAGPPQPQRSLRPPRERSRGPREGGPSPSDSESEGSEASQMFTGGRRRGRRPTPIFAGRPGGEPGSGYDPVFEAGPLRANSLWKELEGGVTAPLLAAAGSAGAAGAGGGAVGGGGGGARDFTRAFTEVAGWRPPRWGSGGSPRPPASPPSGRAQARRPADAAGSVASPARMMRRLFTTAAAPLRAAASAAASAAPAIGRAVSAAATTTAARSGAARVRFSAASASALEPEPSAASLTQEVFGLMRERRRLPSGILWPGDATAPAACGTAAASADFARLVSRSATANLRFDAGGKGAAGAAGTPFFGAVARAPGEAAGGGGGGLWGSGIGSGVGSGWGSGFAGFAGEAGEGSKAGGGVAGFAGSAAGGFAGGRANRSIFPGSRTGTGDSAAGIPPPFASGFGASAEGGHSAVLDATPPPERAGGGAWEWPSPPTLARDSPRVEPAGGRRAVRRSGSLGSAGSGRSSPRRLATKRTVVIAQRSAVLPGITITAIDDDEGEEGGDGGEAGFAAVLAAGGAAAGAGGGGGGGGSATPPGFEPAERRAGARAPSLGFGIGGWGPAGKAAAAGPGLCCDVFPPPWEKRPSWEPPSPLLPSPRLRPPAAEAAEPPKPPTAAAAAFAAPTPPFAAVTTPAAKAALTGATPPFRTDATVTSSSTLLCPASLLQRAQTTLGVGGEGGGRGAASRAALFQAATTLRHLLQSAQGGPTDGSAYGSPVCGSGTPATATAAFYARSRTVSGLAFADAPETRPRPALLRTMPSGPLLARSPAAAGAGAGGGGGGDTTRRRRRAQLAAPTPKLLVPPQGLNEVPVEPPVDLMVRPVDGAEDAYECDEIATTGDLKPIRIHVFPKGFLRTHHLAATKVLLVLLVGFCVISVLLQLGVDWAEARGWRPPDYYDVPQEAT